VAIGGASAGVTVGKRRHRRRPVMAEINVTPMVDVMLVLLIIFMVAAPLMVNMIPVELPEAKSGVAVTGNAKQLTLTVKRASGACSSTSEIYLSDAPIKVEELEAKLTAIKGASQEVATIRINGERDVCYAEVMKILGRVKEAGFGAQVLILPEKGG
jgi:biopolymer transport protein ExbD/biopolymer transport protein TolR